MVTFEKSRDVLKERLEAVFSCSEFMDLYPFTKEPKVFQGFPVNEPPFYVAVDEIVDAATADGEVTMAHARWDFTLRVWCFARHADQKEAADTMLRYVDAVFNAVLADQRLCNTVDNSFPRIESAGTAADSSKRYVAAAAVAIECSVFSHCPEKLLGVVNECNSKRRR